MALHTVQETSKKFKLISVLSILMMIIGAIWSYNVSSDPTSEPNEAMIPSVLIVVGLISWIINKVRIWWNHA